LRLRELRLRIFDGYEEIRATLLVDVEAGRVVKRVFGFESFPEASDRLDLSRWLALPGFIDIHVHLRGLQLSYKEDERSGTLAAAHGGVTAVVDMPNTVPRVNNVSVLEEKLRSLKAYAAVDYALWVGIPDKYEELFRMLSYRGVAGVKVYPEDYDKLRELLRSGRVDGVRFVIHAEDLKYISEGCRPGERWRCRPSEAETLAVDIVGRAVESAGGYVHITHVSSPSTLILAKRRGWTVDTCPHYVLLSAGDEEKLGCAAKVNPPLRPKAVAEALSALLLEVDVVASDHAPHSPEEKSRGFDECPPGIASLDFFAPLILTMVNAGLITLGDAVRLASRGPAKILGLQGWGCIDAGCVASFTVVDPSAEAEVRTEDMASKARVTPYSGLKLRGRVVATVVRGLLAYYLGEFPGEARGRPLEVSRPWLR